MTKKEIDSKPFQIGTMITSMMNLGERWSHKHYFRIISVHPHVVQARDINSGVVYGFPKVDFYTGHCKVSK